jgi:hypothetical protein
MNPMFHNMVHFTAVQIVHTSSTQISSHITLHFIVSNYIEYPPSSYFLSSQLNVGQLLPGYNNTTNS